MDKKINEEYKKYIRDTLPDMDKLWNRIESDIDSRQQILIEEMNKKTVIVHKQGKFRVLVAAVAAVMIFAGGLTVFRKVSDNITKNGSEFTEKNTDTVSESRTKSSENNIGNLSEELEYEKLEFGSDQKKFYDNSYKPDGNEYFVEKDVLEMTDFFADVTVEKADYGSQYATYRFRVNNIISGNGDINTKDFVLTSKTPYLLCEGREYFIPIKENNGKYEIVFENAPQIEITLDEKIVFQNGWKSLDSNSGDVKKSVINKNDFYYDRMKYSSKNDLDNLVDYWQSL